MSGWEREGRVGERTYEPAISDGPADYAPGVAFGADFQGKDLGGVEPGDGKPGCAEGEREDKHH